MNASKAGLDADELLHLALKAMEADRDDDAVAYLKRALEIAPANGTLYYLLGAMHAQMKQYERAVEEMTKATQLAPQLDMAHFQLGLLHLTSGNVDAATAAWAPLDALDDQHPLHLFKTGMLHLSRDEFAECIDALVRGIERNRRYPALNRDMRRVIEKAEAALGAAPAA